MDPKKQFTRQAKLYAKSPLFSSGLSLKLLSSLLQEKKFFMGLDIGTGAGFTAFEISKNSREVIAIDISEGMLEEAESIKREREIDNVTFKIGRAENIESPDESFDLITCRTAAHHFFDIEKSMKEIHRTLKKSGSVYIIDTITSDQKSLNEWHQKIESLRDPSHVKNYSLIEWRSLIRNSDLELKNIFQTRVNMEIEDWMERSGTIERKKSILRNHFKRSSKKVKQFFGIENIENDYKFYWPVGLFEIEKLT